MAAGNYNFTIEQGTTFQRTFKYKDSEGTPIDLTNYDVNMDVRSSISDSTAILDINESSATKNGVDLTDDTFFTITSASVSASANEINLTIDADTTASMSFDTAVYDIEISDNSTPKVITRILQGKIKLSKEVTR
jgi:hypothetical protein